MNDIVEHEIGNIIVKRELRDAIQFKDDVANKQIIIRKGFNLREKDNQIRLITKRIEDRRNLLLNKQDNLKLASQQNEFLHMVRDDYAKYYKAIAQQKQEQIDALKVLEKYISDLKHSEDVSDAHIDEISKDQMRIIKEMREIRQNINQLLSS